MSNSVWCWRIYIKIDDQDEPAVEIIPTDRYTNDVVDDLFAYYNWLCDEYCWYIADTDLIEVPKRNIHNPRWLGFVERYGKGERLHIDYWDWRRNEISYSN